ncbi:MULTISPECIES: palindromic element RPE2 domain-containing protein [unclassified Candidatus Tisiphia]|uniref:palindromic element RPE2 domain-containing protein n=1 Tax=unclassified Candidatus Tisiphia TaxID=2996318 RepID=UPI003CCB0D84
MLNNSYIMRSITFSNIVNSGEFGARSDGATPISNRRAMSDDVTNFSSIDYIRSKTTSSSNFQQLWGIVHFLDAFCRAKNIIFWSQSFYLL